MRHLKYEENEILFLVFHALHAPPAVFFLALFVEARAIVIYRSIRSRSSPPSRHTLPLPVSNGPPPREEGNR